MVEAVSSNRQSVTQSILATSALAGVLNAGLQTACEAVSSRRNAKNLRQAADEYLSKAIKMEQLGKNDMRQFFIELAQEAEQNIAKCKINWKNVGYGAAIGAVATAIICTTLHAITSAFNKN